VSSENNRRHSSIENIFAEEYSSSTHPINALSIASIGSSEGSIDCFQRFVLKIYIVFYILPVIAFEMG
jgi:hypothetical protein